MPKITHAIEPIGVSYICNNCGKGKMVFHKFQADGEAYSGMHHEHSKWCANLDLNQEPKNSNYRESATIRSYGRMC